MINVQVGGLYLDHLKEFFFGIWGSCVFILYLLLLLNAMFNSQVEDSGKLLDYAGRVIPP